MTDGTDVVVVGGGVIGAACAYELARAGAGVVLLERDELASGASGRNHGLLLSPLDPALVAMADASLRLYRDLETRAAIPLRLDASPIGFMICARDDEDERRAAAAEAEAAASCGVRTERLDGDAIRSLEGGVSAGVAGGWLLEDGRRLDPAALTVSLAHAAREHGATIRTRAPVRGFAERDGRVAGVVTDDGTLTAATVVVAAGPWTPSLLRPLGFDVPVRGARGWLAHVRPESPVTARLVGWAGWHAPPDPEPMPPTLADDVAAGGPAPTLGTLVQPNRDGTVLVGGSRQRVVTAEPDDMSVPRELLRRAIELVPALSSASFLGSWWGVRPASADARPIVGRLAEGLVVATGHGSQGVILGGGTAALVRSILAGEPPPFDATASRPDRFDAATRGHSR